MPDPAVRILEALDIGLLVVGVLCALAVAFWLARGGRWRNPLADVALPIDGPSIAAVGAVILVYCCLSLGLSRAFPTSPEELGQPGSSGWHRAQLTGAGINLTVSALMVGILVQAGRDRLTKRVSVAAAAGAAVLCLLVYVPPAMVQIRMGQVVWSWVHASDVPPPTHVVLQALQKSDWGDWGTVQLLVSAVLVAPLVEELFFRGVLLQALCFHLRHRWLAITISAVAFGALHDQPQDVLPLVTMGVILGYLRLRCGTVWPCVLMHALFNARTMTYALLAPELVAS